MSNATTIVPIGCFTPALARRVRDIAIERAQLRAVVISMQSTQRYSWSALCDLAAALRATMTPYPIRLARALPRTRALLGELGIQREWFVDASEQTWRTDAGVRRPAPRAHRAKPKATWRDARFVWRTAKYINN